MSVFISSGTGESSATVDLYVSGVNGSDSNPGTIAAPLATVAEAVARTARNIGLVRIHMGLHGGTGYTPVSIQQRAKYADLVFIGDGAGQPGEDGFVVQLATEAALAGSSTHTLNTTSVLVADAYRGMTVEILTGAAAGDRRTIRSNTTAALRPCVPFSAAIGTGDTFRVVDPSVIWMFPASTGIDFSLLSGCGVPGSGQVTAAAAATAVLFVNMRWTGLATTAAYTVSGSRALMYGVMSSTVVSNTHLPRAEWQAGSELGLGFDCTNVGSFAQGARQPVADGLGAATVTSWRGWGLNYRGAATGALGVIGSVWGTFVGPGIAPSVPGDLYLNSGCLFGGPTLGTLNVSNGGRVRVQAIDSTNLPIQIVGTGANGAVIAQRDGTIYTLIGCEMSNAAGPLVYADSGGSILTVGTCTGNGSTYGYQALGGGIITSSGALTLTGTTNVANVDGVAYAAAAFPATYSAAVGAGGSRLIRV